MRPAGQQGGSRIWRICICACLCSIIGSVYTRRPASPLLIRISGAPSPGVTGWPACRTRLGRSAEVCQWREERHAQQRACPGLQPELSTGGRLLIGTQTCRPAEVLIC